MLRLVTPDVFVDSVLDLDAERLRCMGLQSLLLDVDCTLKTYGSSDPGAEVLQWLARTRDAGIRLCLLSNGRGPRIRALAERLDLPFVHEAHKPLPFGCRAALRQHGFDRKRTALVGDQLFADVMAGRLAGLMTILVRPMHPEEEPWFTRIKRPLERVCLRRMASRHRR